MGVMALSFAPRSRGLAGDPGPRGGPEGVHGHAQSRAVGREDARPGAAGARQGRDARVDIAAPGDGRAQGGHHIVRRHLPGHGHEGALDRLRPGGGPADNEVRAVHLEAFLRQEAPL